MLVNEAIKKIMKEKGVKQQAMAIMIGKSKANEVSARLNYSNMTIGNIIEMLEVLGYEVVIQEKRAGKRREDQIVIEREAK